MVYSDLVVNGMFMQFLGEILREVSLGEERGAPHFSNQSIAQQVREYLNRNMDRSVSLDELGENIHVSKYHSIPSRFANRPRQAAARDDRRFNQRYCRIRRLPEHLFVQPRVQEARKRIAIGLQKIAGILHRLRHLRGTLFTKRPVRKDFPRRARIPPGKSNYPISISSGSGSLGNGAVGSV